MASTYSFDVVSDFDRQELVNALDQSRREIKSRYDLKDTKTTVDLKEESIQIATDSEKEDAKKISKLIKDNLKKVQASIQGDSVRVSAKNKDDLQAAIALIKEEDWPMALQFQNYR